MKQEKIKNIAEIIDGELTDKNAENVYVRGVGVDTRTIRAGEIFFALKAERDGHEFVLDAYQKGALLAVVERKLELPIPQIIVRDTLSALGKLALSYRNAINPKVVSITGSVGKTTAREMVTKVLSHKFNVHSAKKNFNNLIGLPLTLLEMDEDTEIAVVELGINQPDEMDKLAEIAAPDIAVITSIASVHTEGLGSLDNIFAEKLKIAKDLSPDNPLFLNIDSELLNEFAKNTSRKIITYAIERNADFRAINLSFSAGKPSFTIDGVDYKLELYGKAPIYAALCAIAVGSYFDVPQNVISDNLADSASQSHRMDLTESNGIKILDDSYNSSPVALLEAFDTIEMIPANRKWVIIGDMLELGDFSEKYHRQAGAKIVEHKFDCAVFFGESMLFAAEQADNMHYNGKFIATQNFDDAFKFIKENLLPGDLVLIKGSHSIGMIKFVEELKKWLSKEK
ncbi:UDP-N-acetylmuramoyl-tripeptide--D-alanyl-D-alanine ligase [bacterium]|nr:UDP-N-acetylmuramoyl-tripeptide--D-alanyl-D-alanine ligase [bacterium]